MAVNPAWIKKHIYFVVVFTLSLLTYLILYLFRSFDDNRLVSWDNTFAVADPLSIFIILSAGLAAALFFSKVNIPDRYRAIFLFFISYIFSAFFWSDPETIIDASRYFTYAKHIEIYGIRYFFREWGAGMQVWTDMPLVPLLYGLVFKFIGESRLYIQILISFLFSLTVVMTYLTGKELWDSETGFFAGILTLGIPYLFTQLPLMLVDVPVMFLIMASVFFFIRALKRGGIMMLPASLLIFFTFYSKYSTWLMLSVLAVVLLVYSLEGAELSLNRACLKRPEYVKRGLLVILMAGLLISAVFLYKYNVFSEQIKLLITYQRPGLNRWGESFVSTFFFQIHPFVSLAAVCSLFIAFRNRDLKYLIVVWLLLLIFILQIRRIRYIIMIFPMLSLAASYGIARIRDKHLARYISYSILVLSFVIALFTFSPFLKQISFVNLKDAGRYLDSIEEPVASVFVLPSTKSVVNTAIIVPILDLHTRKQIIYDYKAEFNLTKEKIEISPLRFTWTYRNPLYYKDVMGKSDGNSAVVVISDETVTKLPAIAEQMVSGMRKIESFNVKDNVFRLQTFVTVYSKEKASLTK